MPAKIHLFNNGKITSTSTGIQLSDSITLAFTTANIAMQKNLAKSRCYGIMIL